MKLLRVAGATLNQTPLDFAGNAARIGAVLRQAQTQGVELLCLPELCLTGYGCEDAFFSLYTAQRAHESLIELLPQTRGLTVVLGLPHFHAGALYNCVAMVQDGRVLGVNAKRVLPREGVHYEPRWFRPWPFGKVVETQIGSEAVPMGDVRYRLGGIGVAIEICEEAWDSVPAAAAHADAVDLILNPSASHFALGKYAKREHLVANSSRSMQVTYVYTNLVGCEAGRMIYDGGVLFAENGEIVARGPRFGFSDASLTWWDVNPELARLNKLKVKPVRDWTSEANGSACEAGHELVGDDPRKAATSKVLKRSEPLAYEPLGREREFLQAQMLGLFDYLRKSASQGFVLSLSGGVDSAACAVLVAQMLAHAFLELGPQALWQRLGFTGPPAADVQSLIRDKLICVYQKTANSGAVTEAAAAELATGLGAAFHVDDVNALVDGYTVRAEAVLGRRLSWEHDDLALQNIQARARAPLVWLVANARKFLLLTTSNRSEAAVGYATMDGDMAGGLAPLGGIDKHFLQHWLVWAQHDLASGLGPVAALAAVTCQEPTAELRPKRSGAAPQTDEADLMPYAVLERIERLFVRDRLGPDDVLQCLGFEFPSIDAATRAVYLERFFRLWSANQWKRERMAPSFHLDDLSVDPKSWCRYPILSAPLVAKR